MKEGKKGESRLGRAGRLTVKRKREAVLRLPRGEDLELVSRELGVTAARLAKWRNAFLDFGETGMRVGSHDPQLLQKERMRLLEARIGQLTMDNELLQEKIARMEEGRPLASRRPK